MKQLFSFLTVVLFLFSCSKPGHELSTEIPVTFKYSSPDCERPEIKFTGETFGDVTTITDDATINLRSDQQYTVSFRLVAERCSSGAIILGGTDPNEVNIWLNTYPGSDEKQHVNLESNYYVVVLGE